MIIIAFLTGLIIGSITTLAFVLFRYKLRTKAHRVNTIHGEWRFGVNDLFNERFVNPPEHIQAFTTMYHPVTNKVIALTVDNQEDFNRLLLDHYNDQV